MSLVRYSPSTVSYTGAAVSTASRYWNSLTPQQKKAALKIGYHSAKYLAKRGRKVFNDLMTKRSKSEMKADFNVKRGSATEINRPAGVRRLLTNINNERKTHNAVSGSSKAAEVPNISYIDLFYPRVKVSEANPYVITENNETLIKSVQWGGAQQGFLWQSLYPIWTDTKNAAFGVTNVKYAHSLSLEALINKCNDTNMQDWNNLNCRWSLPNIPNGSQTNDMTNRLFALDSALFHYHSGHIEYTFQNTMECRVTIMINEYTPREKLTHYQNPVQCMMWDNWINSNTYDRTNNGFKSQNYLANDNAPFDLPLAYKDTGDLSFGPRKNHSSLHKYWHVSKTVKYVLDPGDRLVYRCNFPGFNLSEFSQLWRLHSAHMNQATSESNPEIYNWDYMPLFSKYLTFRFKSEVAYEKPVLSSATVDGSSLNLPDKIDSIANMMGQVTCTMSQKHIFRKLPNYRMSNVFKANRWSLAADANAVTHAQANAATNMINVEDNQNNDAQNSNVVPAAVYLTTDTGQALRTFTDTNGAYLGNVIVGNPSTTTALNTGNTSSTTVSFGTAAVVPNGAFASAGLNTV